MKGSIDTTNIITYKDSSKTGKINQIIVIQDKKKDIVKSWYENPIFASIFIPILISIVTIWITKLFNKKKEQVDQEKIREEIKKLHTENDNMRKSFQPIVISSLQTIQSEVLKVKIDALKQLNEIKRDFLEYDGPSYPDDFVMDADDYYENIFYKFNSDRSENYKKFLLQYSYVFPDTVISSLEKTGIIAAELTITNSSMSEDNPNPDSEDISRVKDLILKMDEAIKALRSDLHLDNDFIHKFIKQNQDIS